MLGMAKTNSNLIKSILCDYYKEAEIACAEVLGGSYRFSNKFNILKVFILRHVVIPLEITYSNKMGGCTILASNTERKNYQLSKCAFYLRRKCECGCHKINTVERKERKMFGPFAK